MSEALMTKKRKVLGLHVTAKKQTLPPLWNPLETPASEVTKSIWTEQTDDQSVSDNGDNYEGQSKKDYVKGGVPPHIEKQVEIYGMNCAFHEDWHPASEEGSSFSLDAHISDL
eukprot:CAMPEP_0113899124 /NCGR_PEP_ID=MMETSP0780_2-20120614/19816_1 /TAXON_ID=652834 /ORGANISM="Palpitomonas bilix" /LENGTH=112 /DNA_ID=CAMNT_0000891175 /DNA_START=124 /DNA_END=462 /DNA_ORIENTATION=- /assembly_acc=CAM_ASM_000599